MNSPIRSSAADKPNRNRGDQAGRIRAARPAGALIRIPIWKKTLFSVVTVVIFFTAVECLLTLAGVRVVGYEEDPCVGFSSYLPLFLEQATGDGERVLATAPNKRAFFNHQQFPVKKQREHTAFFV